jgi:DNA-binding NtrC family response regulator
MPFNRFRKLNKQIFGKNRLTNHQKCCTYSEKKPPEETQSDFEGIIGKSLAMKSVFDLVKQVAPSNTSVLILRESGGKEGIATVIHRREDIPLLASHFMRYYSRLSNKPIRAISESAMKQLRHYNWPGNIRELQHLNLPVSTMVSKMKKLGIVKTSMACLID